MKEVIFDKKHPKGLVREVDEKEYPPLPHEKDNLIEEKQELSNDIILVSPNGTKYKLTVSDKGEIKAKKTE